MDRVFSFFFPLLVSTVVFAGLSMSFPAAIQGQDSGQSDRQPDSGSPLYQSALEQFKGPSRVYLSDAESGPLSRWTGPISMIENAVVLDWNERDLVIVRKDGQDKATLPSARVVRMEIGWANDLAAQMHEDFAEGRYDSALKKGAVLLGKGPDTPSTPRWQQRLLLAELVEASAALGNWERAASLYIYIARDQAPPLALVSVPLPWTNSSAEIRDRAKLQERSSDWINDPKEPIQLLGAAWLLDSDRRSEASKVLIQLTKSNQVWVAKYAEAQLWRTVSLPKDADEKWESWIALRDTLPMPWQAGPTHLLADKLAISGNTEKAAEQWLRYALLHREHASQSRHAIRKAEESLRGLNRQVDAEIVKSLSRKLSP